MLAENGRSGKVLRSEPGGVEEVCQDNKWQGADTGQE